MAFAQRFQSLKLAGIFASAVVGAGAFGVASTAMAQATPPIAVTVDGNQVMFGGTQPIELHGSVLVPLRGVFESLGADVEYDASTQAVTATKGDRTVVVPIGSATATIDGQPEPLSQPARIYNGSTMVPLRFVAEALGDYVEWGDQTHMVSITTIARSPNVAAVPPADSSMNAPHDFSVGNEAVTGVVRRVIADSDPRQIIVRINGVDREIPVSDAATVIRGRIGRDGEAVSLADIQPGDRVVIHRSDDGSALRIASSFGVIYGTVSTVAMKDGGRTAIVLNDGSSVDLASSVRVWRNGAFIAPEALNAGDQVTITTDPEDNIAYRVSVHPPIFAHRR